MKCRPQPIKMKRSGLSLVAIKVLSMALILSCARSAWAQDSASPDMRMLLNLDLFRSRPQASSASQTGDSNGSLLEQIRTLNALGYLDQGNESETAAKPAGALRGIPERSGPTAHQGSPE
jgi:hypothetical protein